MIFGTAEALKLVKILYVLKEVEAEMEVKLLGEGEDNSILVARDLIEV